MFYLLNCFIQSLLKFNMQNIFLLQFKMSQGSLSSILNQNKLTGDNFANWNRNLLIVLSFEKHKYVLEKECPPVPKENAPTAESMTFDDWVNSNEIARCYMMASMSSVLKKQHK